MRTGTLLLLLFAAVVGHAQYDTRLLDDVATQYEKIYVKLDRDVYVTGGTIRYRAFLADAGLIQANVKSRILYFELTGTGLSEPIRWRNNLSDANAIGAFDIPASLPSGVYSLKAYTNWVRNGDPDYIFSADVLLFNISDETTADIPMGAGQNDQGDLISFFPEGGTVIENIPCKIGYRLNTGQDAIGPVQLTVKENDSTAVLQIMPDSSGFGSFHFLPETGKDYYAELTLAEEQIVRVAMPYIEPDGFTLQAEEAQDGLDVIIRGRFRDESQRTSLHLMAESRGNILLDTVFTMIGDRRLIHIPSSRLDAGILFLTLYDSRRFSLGHRLYYISGSDRTATVRMSGLRESYSRDERIRFELAVDGFQPEDKASFAISVSQQYPFQDLIGQPGIREYLLLNSEIKDMPVFIGNLQGMPSSKIQDLLLLVNENDYAWNYSNKTILSDCLYEKEENGFILKGSLNKKDSGEPMVDASIMISTTDSIAPRMIYTSTDEKGEFYTLLNSFFDNKDIILQVADDVDPSDLVWNIENKTIPVPLIPQVSHMLTKAEQQYAEQSRNIQLITEVYGSSSQTTVHQDTNAPEIIFLHPDMVVYPADFTELINFKEITDNILPTVRFIRRNQQYSTEVFNDNNELWLSSRQVLLNGVLFRDLDYVATLGSDDITKIEVYNTNVLFGKLTIPGLVSIYTSDGEVPEQYLKNNTHVIHNDVLVNSSPDPAPWVAGNAGEDPSFPDFRQTLFWSPDVKVTGSETVILEFTASQLQGRYLVDVQGISESGVPLENRFSFTVE